MTTRRTAGLALGGYVIATTIAFVGSTVPGGDYEPDKIQAFLRGGHLSPILLEGLLLLAGLALLVLGRHVRDVLQGGAGALAGDLAIVAASVGVVGGMARGGVSIALVEGGPAVATGLPLPVVYTLGEVANLLACCAPAFAVGAMGLLMVARYPMPTWLRVMTVAGALGGLAAPLFFTFFVYLLWALIFGTWLVVRGAAAPQPRPAVSTARGSAVSA